MPHQSHAPHRPLRVVLGAVACAILVVAVLAARTVPFAHSSRSAGGDGLALTASNLPFTMLCQGFTDCGDKGYSDAGYGIKANYNTMYWDMYSGSNCVNYVAYRMIKGGMSATRPSQLKPGKGNAEYWGTSFPGITDRTPAAGAVAWWKGGATGAGAEGHVAYVEKVISPSDIIISESNWGSPFDWREITGPTDWPTGFIHFADKKVTPVAPPSILGTPQVGVALKANPGKWSPQGTVSYQWRVSGQTVGTGRTYVPDATVQNKKVFLLVTAAAKNYATRQMSVPTTTKTAPGQFATTVAPVIAGAAQASLPLTVKTGAFSPKPDSESIQWLANGQPIAGATAPTYTPTVDEIGQQITAQVVIQAAGYTATTITTSATAAVLGLPLTATGGAVTGKPVRGGELSLDPGTFNTDGITPTIQWVRDGVAIPGAAQATYHPTTADVGHHLTAVVSAAKYQYVTYNKTYYEGYVSTQGVLSVSAVGGNRSMRVHIHLTAPGMSPDVLNRKVTVAVGHATGTVVMLRQGVGTVDLTDVGAGRRYLHVTWAGTPLIAAAKVVVPTRVYTPEQWAQRQASSVDSKPSTAKSVVTEPSTKATASATPSAKPSTKASATPSAKPSTKPSTKATASASAKATAKATTSAKATASAKATTKATASASASKSSTSTKKK